MNKKRNEELMRWADEALRENRGLILQEDGCSIIDSYNGQIAALGVMIAMSGLRPALAIYYQESESRMVKRRNILTVIAKMMGKDQGFGHNFDKAESLVRFALENDDSQNRLRREIIDCAVALKQVVRTYNLIRKDR